MKSLKISKVHNYPNELLKRLRGVNSPSKRKLVQDIKDSNWEAVYEELLYRIELYAANKVVNYTRKDLAELVINIAKHQPAVLASALYEKNFGTGDNDELFDENFPEILESTVSYIIKECTDKLIPKINEAVANGKFELHELFDMRIDDTNYHALNPSDFVVAAMEKFGFDSDENEKLFDYLYDLVEDRVTQIIFP